MQVEGAPRHQHRASVTFDLALCFLAKRIGRQTHWPSWLLDLENYGFTLVSLPVSLPYLKKPAAFDLNEVNERLMQIRL